MGNISLPIMFEQIDSVTMSTTESDEHLSLDAPSQGTLGGVKADQFLVQKNCATACPAYSQDDT